GGAAQQKSHGVGHVSPSISLQAVKPASTTVNAARPVNGVLLPPILPSKTTSSPSFASFFMSRMPLAPAGSLAKRNLPPAPTFGDFSFEGFGGAGSLPPQPERISIIPSARPRNIDFFMNEILS